MRKIRKRIFYKVGAVAFLLTVALLLIFRQPEEIDRETKIGTNNSNNSLDPQKNKTEFDARKRNSPSKLDIIKIIERSIRSPLNQGECRHPHLPLYNPDIMKFYTKVEKIDCGDALDDWVMCEKSICFVKPEINAKHGEVTCSYTDLIRKSDYKVKYGKTTKTKEPYVLQESDFVKVVCSDEDGLGWFGMAFGIRDAVPIPQPSFNAPEELPAGMERPPHFNVLIYGFDSMSRNAVMRKLPKTYSYLTEHLQAIVLKGYNIVGDGTPQALVPLLTGYTELELPETRKRMRHSFNVDVYPMIWNDYTRHGYATAFNEDVPNIGTFTYRMNGFDDQPVDHYLRTFYMEAANIWSSSKADCVGHQPDFKVMLEYTKMFMNKYSETPRFVFSFHGGLSHDSINSIGAADDDILAWLTSLQKMFLLDNTILVFMSDHGNRFSAVRATLQGKQEERLPFFSFVFPATFKKRFPQQYANFEQNAERLTTPFDIHATLKDILKIQTSNGVAAVANTKETTSPSSADADVHISAMATDRAISLFERIPQNRSCADAYIEPHWCACLNWQQLSLNDTSGHMGTLITLAGSIVVTINEATLEYRSLCAPLTMYKINWAMRLLPHKELVNFKRNSDVDGFLADMSDSMHLSEELYQLQIEVQAENEGGYDDGEPLPIFEASVAYDLRTFKARTKLTEISRVNKYGTQANCIYDRNPELRKYCYCRVGPNA